MDIIREQLPFTLDEFDAGDLGQRYKGKVRENFHVGDEIIMITTEITTIIYELSFFTFSPKNVFSALTFIKPNPEFAIK